MRGRGSIFQKKSRRKSLNLDFIKVNAKFDKKGILYFDANNIFIEIYHLQAKIIKRNEVYTAIVKS